MRSPFPRVRVLAACALLGGAVAAGALLAGATAGAATLLALVAVAVLLSGHALGHAAGRRHGPGADHAARRRLEALVGHASDALLVLDRAGVVAHATPAATTLFGTSPVGWHADGLLERIAPEDRARVVDHLLSPASASDPATRHEVRIHGPDHQVHHVEVTATDRRDDPDLHGTVVRLHDVTDRAELERSLRHLAFHDPLTGLCNRELFQDRLLQGLRRAERDGRRVAVLLCDLDDFKDVNDTHGHAAGDALLQELAQRLRAAARASDTVARLGGDEFAVVCEGIELTRDAIDVARRVLSATTRPLVVGGHELTIGVSVGIAVDDGHRTADELLRDADIALYEAKDDGKQRWALHERSMTDRAQQRLQLASDLARAVAQGAIEAAFQPIVTLDEERIVGIEVLARWEHPQRGWISPGEFIPIAEQSGLIVELGDQLLDLALRALRSWLDERPDLVLRVGVNVSGRQMRDPGLPGRVARRLAAFDVDPSMLVMELTESVMLDEADLAIEVMHELRQLGVRFAVDDFGTGYSSLAYLRRLPVAIVKTDRAFVQALGGDPGARDLVRAIIEMGRSLRLDVVAEGVETAEQVRQLRELGCAFAQGHRFARPVSAAALGPRLLAPDARVVTRVPDTGATSTDHDTTAPAPADGAPDGATATGRLRSG